KSQRPPHFSRNTRPNPAQYTSERPQLTPRFRRKEGQTTSNRKLTYETTSKDESFTNQAEPTDHNEATCNYPIVHHRCLDSRVNLRRRGSYCPSDCRPRRKSHLLAFIRHHPPGRHHTVDLGRPRSQQHLGYSRPFRWPLGLRNS